MKLRVVDVGMRAKRPKATVHKTGKLGFNKDAADVLALDESPTFLVALNEEDEGDDNLYLIPAEDSDDRAITAAKAGDYYYLNLKDFYRRRGVDLESTKVIYDIVKTSYNEESIFELRARERER